MIEYEPTREKINLIAEQYKKTTELTVHLSDASTKRTVKEE